MADEFIEAKAIPVPEFKTEMSEEEVKETETFLDTTKETAEQNPEAPNAGDEAFVNTPMVTQEPTTVMKFIEWRNKILGEKPLSKWTYAEIQGALKAERKDWADKLLAAHKKVMVRRGLNVQKKPTSTMVIEVTEDLAPEAVEAIKQDSSSSNAVPFENATYASDLKKSSSTSTRVDLSDLKHPKNTDCVTTGAFKKYYALFIDNLPEILLNTIIIVLGAVLGYYTARFVSSLFNCGSCCAVATAAP